VSRRELIALGIRSYSSKRKAAQDASAVLNAQPIGVPLVGEARDFIEAVLMRHPAVAGRMAGRTRPERQSGDYPAHSERTPTR